MNSRFPNSNVQLQEFRRIQIGEIRWLNSDGLIQMAEVRWMDFDGGALMHELTEMHSDEFSWG